jgi:hypothetical protein
MRKSSKSGTNLPFNCRTIQNTQNLSTNQQDALLADFGNDEVEISAKGEENKEKEKKKIHRIVLLAFVSVSHAVFFSI